MNTKPRAKFDPGQQRYIILCGCGNYCKDTEILCGRCRYYHDNRISRRPENDVPIGLNLQKDPLPGASFVEFIPIDSEIGRILRIKFHDGPGPGPEAVKRYWREDQARKSEEASRIADEIHKKAIDAAITRRHEKRDRHVKHALKDSTYTPQMASRVYRPNMPYGQRLASVTIDLMKAEEEIARLQGHLHKANAEIIGLQGVEKSLRAQLEEANSVTLTASFQVGHDVKFTSMTSLGWVNIYKNSNGRLQTGGCPHSTQWSASSTRSSNPIGKYLGTFQIFAKDFEP